MARLWIVVLFFACGGKASPREATQQPRSVANAQVTPDAAPTRLASAPRPSVGVERLIPDPSDELRWPLSTMSHPAMQPKYPIASVLAQPGVGWIELCKRGVHLRTSPTSAREPQTYLAGWCAALKGDIGAACSNLGPLVSSTTPGMSSAVKVDLATIIASSGHIEQAEHWLNAYRIDDAELLDILAATYVHLGDYTDALEINRRVIGSDDSASAGTKCRRLVKHVLLAPPAQGLGAKSQLADFASQTNRTDPTCSRLYYALACASDPSNRCVTYFEQMGIPKDYEYVVRAWEQWPVEAVDQHAWLRVFDTVSNAMDLPEAEQMMEVALGAAMTAAGGCTAPIDDTVRSVAIRLNMYSRQLPKRVAKLVERCAH
jgi:hypothetical protein